MSPRSARCAGRASSGGGADAVRGTQGTCFARRHTSYRKCTSGARLANILRILSWPAVLTVANPCQTDESRGASSAIGRPGIAVFTGFTLLAVYTVFPTQAKRARERPCRRGIFSCIATLARIRLDSVRIFPDFALHTPDNSSTSSVRAADARVALVKAG